MLIEMVAVTLTVFAGLSPLSDVIQKGSVPTKTPVTQEAIASHDFSSPDEGLQVLHQEGLVLDALPTPESITPVPEDALESELPTETILAMLAPSITSIPEPTPTLLPSATPSPQIKEEVKAAIVTPTPSPLPTETPTPTPTTPPVVTAPVDLESLFARFSDEYKVDKELLKRIAKCESNFNAEAVNGDYLGMFQFAASSWGAVRGRMGADTNPDLRKNAEETIKTAAYHIANGGQGAWPSCK